MIATDNDLQHLSACCYSRPRLVVWGKAASKSHSLWTGSCTGFDRPIKFSDGASRQNVGPKARRVDATCSTLGISWPDPPSAWGKMGYVVSASAMIEGGTPFDRMGECKFPVSVKAGNFSVHVGCYQSV